jgi:hypothetical protein|tara:strand:+ start:7676 stop:7984 length:309 start_codon:yes stop_codon:yes gene_type:complete
MSPDFISKWESLIEDVDKHRVPVQFIKKLIIKLVSEDGKKRQQTINIEKLFMEGLNISSVEDAIGNRLSAVQDEIVNIDFILNIATIADAVQPETDNLLKKL